MITSCICKVIVPIVLICTVLFVGYLVYRRWSDRREDRRKRNAQMPLY